MPSHHRRSYTLQQHKGRIGFRGNQYFRMTIQGLVTGAVILSLLCPGIYLSNCWGTDDEVSASDANSKEAIAAKQKKVDELLDTTSAQLKRSMYQLALGTLDQCTEFNDAMSSSQQKRIENYREEAQTGLTAQEQASQSLQTSDNLMAEGQLDQAQEELEKASGYKKYLPEGTQKKIQEKLAAIETMQKQQAGRYKQLFKESVQNYRAGNLDQAKQGFTEIKSSGTELGFFDRGGDFTTVEGYLAKIDKKQAAIIEAGQKVQEQEEVVAEVTPVEEGAANVSPEMEAEVEEAVAESEPVEMEREALEKELAATEPSETAAPVEIKEPIQPEPAEEVIVTEEVPVETSPVVTEEVVVAVEPVDEANPAAEPVPGESQAVEPLKNGPNILERVKARERIQIQSIEASFLEMKTSVQKKLEQNQYDEARADITQMLTTIEGAKQLLGAQRYGNMKGEARGLLELLNEQEKTWKGQVLDTQIRKAQTEELERQRRAEAARQQKIQDLFTQAISFREEREYEQASSTLQRILELDPKNEQATWLKEDMDLMLIMREQAEQARVADREEKKVLIEAREATTPWSEQVHFPEDWVEMTERRKNLKDDGTTARTEEEVYTYLNSKKVDLEVNEAEFQQVLNDLAIDYKLNINVLWNSLEYAGIERSDPVTLQLGQVTLEKALDSVLAYMSGGREVKVGYVVDQGVVTIAAEEDLPVMYYTKVYYVADLLGRRSVAYEGLLDSESGSGGGSGGGMGGRSSSGGGRSSSSSGGGRSSSSGGGRSSRSGGGGGSRSSGGGGSSSGSGDYEDIYSRIDDLTYMIQGAVDQNSWDWNMMQSMGGGGMGGMRGGMGMMGGQQGETMGQGTLEVFRGSELVVKQTQKNHRIIENLLKDLRRTLGEQVSIEARFLVINSNFLEDIGVDIDFFLNMGNAGYDPAVDTDGNPVINPAYGNRVLNERTNPGPWNRTTAFPMTQDGSSFTTPGSTGVPGSLGGGSTPTAFTVAGSFLDNIQVDFLMRATQAHQRSRSLEAPHVTVFNGEEATVTFYVTQPYVRNMQAETGNAVGMYTPDIQDTGTGIELVIAPTITVDKRYVILNVEVIQEKLLEMKTFVFNQAGSGTTDTTGNQTTVGGDNDNINTASTGIIQQPVSQQNQIQTRVSVPDGGTLLLGGQKLTGEVEKEIGVPGLSKIPIVKRLFTNKSIVKDESVLLILIKPKIILQQEQEDLRFGSLKGAGE